MGFGCAFYHDGEDEKEMAVTVNLNKNMKSICVAILGTDGAGKTTVINLVKGKLIDEYGCEVLYQHMRPNWLPALGVATGVREKGDGTPVANPHAQKASGFLSSTIRLAYYWLDYSIGYWVKTWPILKKKGRICIFDRYFYDFLIDPRRMRINLPRWMMRAAFVFVPKPDLVICLGADPQVLYARKPETSLDEVKRQVSLLRQLATVTKNAHWIDTGQSIDETVTDVMKALKAECFRS